MTRWCWIILIIQSLQQFEIVTAQTQRINSAAIPTQIPPLFDSTRKNIKDSLVKRKHDPRKATLRSAILPGWGQAYNREYWKLPIVYAALGIPAGFFIYNNTWYKKTKRAYEIKINNDEPNFPTIDPKLQNLSVQSLQFYRNEFRKNKDYSALWFFIAWGLNVVDATVFGHLKEFNVTDDLGLQLTPQINTITNTPGLALVFSFKSPQPKKSTSR